MAVIISIPIFIVLLMLQTGVVSRTPLLHGSADLLLLAMLAWALQKRVQTALQWSVIGGLLASVVTSLPAFVPLLAYPLTVGIALVLKRRVWQVPLLAMFVATFFGTLLTQGISLAALRLFSSPLSWGSALNLTTLPSLLLNLLLAIPFYVLMSDLASWLYPEELEV